MQNCGNLRLHIAGQDRRMLFPGCIPQGLQYISSIVGMWSFPINSFSRLFPALYQMAEQGQISHLWRELAEQLPIQP
jgi:hypothetical protein